MDEPKLSEQGHKEFEALIDSAKAKIKSAADNAISDLYCNITQHIESDAWQNYRNQLKQELAYDNGILKEDGPGWARNVRAKIFAEHRNQLVEMLNRDHLEKIRELEERNLGLLNFRSRY